LNAGSVLVMLPACGVQGDLSLSDSLLPSFALFSLSLLLFCAFALSACLLPLECERGLAVRCIVGGLLRMLLRLAAARGFLRSTAVVEIARQFGVLFNEEIIVNGCL
jgi:hypothetical protein